MNQPGHLVIVLFLGMLVSACEPIGPVPGKSLSGEVTQPPASFDSLNQAEVVQLETEGPYSVNLWGVGLDGFYYVAASKGKEARWAEHVSEDPNVRLRVEDKLYELTAEVVSEPAELERVAEIYKNKYDLDADADFPEAIIFRLGPRPQ